jgi:hypothetical protein
MAMQSDDETGNALDSPSGEPPASQALPDLAVSPDQTVPEGAQQGQAYGIPNAADQNLTGPIPTEPVEPADPAYIDPSPTYEDIVDSTDDQTDSTGSSDESATDSASSDGGDDGGDD